MNRKEYEEQIDIIFDKASKLMKKKNKDYATERDPFLNFKFAESLGTSVETGIIVRMGDKLVRTGNILNNSKEAAVSAETVEDTLLDLIAYSAILLTYIKENRVLLVEPRHIKMENVDDVPF